MGIHALILAAVMLAGLSLIPAIRGSLNCTPLLESRCDGDPSMDANDRQSVYDAQNFLDGIN